MDPKTQGKPKKRIDEYFLRTKRPWVPTRADWIQLIIYVLILGFNLTILKQGRLERFENVFLDTFFQIRPVQPVSEKLAIIEIDEESVRSIGSWPWPWRYHAEMVNLLKEWGAKAIVFDFPFDDPLTAEEEAELAAAFKNAENVYLPVLYAPKKEKKIWVHSLPVVLEQAGSEKVWNHSVKSIEDNAKGLGHIDYEPDRDGKLRRVYPHISTGEESYDYLGLKVARDHSKKGKKIILDDRGKMIVNWAGKWAPVFQKYSFADIIRSAQALRRSEVPVIDSGIFYGKICVIGLSAPGVASFMPTPAESQYPRVGVQTNVMNSVLTGRGIRPPTFQLSAWILISLGFLASVLFVVFRNEQSLVAGLLLGGGWSAISFVAFLNFGIWLPLVHPVLLMVMLFIFSAVYDFAVSRKERSKLFDLATRDGLTGLFVIRHFREILNQAVIESIQMNKPLSLILIDIDNFKPINDTYGHPAGDMVLRQTAEIIANCFRTKRPVHQIDFAARYGGEEFIIMVRDVGAVDAAAKVAERIRRAVEENVFEWESKKIPVTISLGVSEIHPGEKHPDVMVRRADEALYRAKKSGKNRVCTET